MNDKNAAVARLLFPDEDIDGSWLYNDGDTKMTMIKRYTEDLKAIVEAVLALGYEYIIQSENPSVTIANGNHSQIVFATDKTPQAIAAALVDALLAAEGVEL